MSAEQGERNLVNIHLGGKLGQLHGEIWRLAVSSPAEALQAIDTNLRGALRRYLIKEGAAQYYRVAVGNPDQALDAEELGNRSGGSDIFVYPVPSGRNSGVGKIIIGAVLIAAAIVTQQYELLGKASLVFASAAAGIGTSLLMGGIAQLLAPHAKDSGSQLNSNGFQGTIASAQQGGSVPVVYGRALVAPTPISIWFTNTDYNTTTNSYVGVVELRPLPGGGTQYVVPDPVATNPPS